MEANNKTITNEALKKAFEILDQATELIKGNESTPLANNGGADEPDASEVQKAIPFAEMLVKGGMDKDAACDVMVKGGMPLNVAQCAYACVIAAANASKEGGDTQTLNASEAGLKKSDLIEEINKSLEPVNNSIIKGFDGVKEFMENLINHNDVLQKSYEALALRIEELEKQPVGGRKSVTQVQAIEKFQKSNQELPIGTVAYNIESKEDLQKLVDRIDAENDTIIQKSGQSDPLLVNCISSIEITKQVPETAYNRLRSMGIILTKPSA